MRRMFLSLVVVVVIWTADARYRPEVYHPFRFPGPQLTLDNGPGPNPPDGPRPTPPDEPRPTLPEGPRPTPPDGPRPTPPDGPRREPRAEPRPALRDEPRPTPPDGPVQRPLFSKPVRVGKEQLVASGVQPLPVSESSDSESFSFDRDLGGGNIVGEYASSTNGNLVVFDSTDPALEEQDFTRATTTYDFSTPNPVVAIAPTDAPVCFLISTNLTYQQALESLRIINGSIAISNEEVALDGTRRPLSREQRESLLQSNPAIRDVCEGKLLVATVPEGQENQEQFQGPTQELSISTFESIVNIRVPAPPRRSFGPRPEELPPRGPGEPGRFDAL